MGQFGSPARPESKYSTSFISGDDSLFPLTVSSASFLSVASILLIFSVITSSFLPALKDCLNIMPAASVAFHCNAERIFNPIGLIGFFCITQSIRNHRRKWSDVCFVEMEYVWIFRVGLYRSVISFRYF